MLAKSLETAFNESQVSEDKGVDMTAAPTVPATLPTDEVTTAAPTDPKDTPVPANPVPEREASGEPKKRSLDGVAATLQANKERKATAKETFTATLVALGQDESISKEDLVKELMNLQAQMNPGTKLPSRNPEKEPLSPGTRPAVKAAPKPSVPPMPLTMAATPMVPTAKAEESPEEKTSTMLPPQQPPKTNLVAKPGGDEPTTSGGGVAAEVEPKVATPAPSVDGSVGGAPTIPYVGGGEAPKLDEAETKGNEETPKGVVALTPAPGKEIMAHVKGEASDVNNAVHQQLLELRRDTCMWRSWYVHATCICVMFYVVREGKKAGTYDKVDHQPLGLTFFSLYKWMIVEVIVWKVKAPEVGEEQWLSGVDGCIQKQGDPYLVKSKSILVTS